MKLVRSPDTGRLENLYFDRKEIFLLTNNWMRDYCGDF